MTDKQIIIDSVDVSGCCCIENGYCLWIKKYYETGLTPKCEQVKDCYYKQLKRVENQIVDLNKMVEAKEQKLGKIKDYCKEQNLKADWTACEILKIIEE